MIYHPSYRSVLTAALIVLTTLTCAGEQPRELRIAVAQPLVHVGDVPQNLKNMEPLVAEAARRGARLVVFSECGLTGYDLKGLGAKAALTLAAPELDEVGALAKKHSMTIITGLYERLGDKLYNTAIVLDSDGQRVVQRKHRILGLERKACPVTPSERARTLFEVDGFRFGLLICSDAGIPGIYDELAAAKCDGVILVVAGGGDARAGWHQDALAMKPVRKKFNKQTASALSAEAIDLSVRLNLAQIACNQSGYDAATGYFHCGGSSIINRTGEATAVIAPRFVFEQLRPDLAVGLITRSTSQP
jgi:predicted amidohydrolase